jgi:peptidoglycan hydrolase-like protein with peptidoglycan-binding domain
MGVVTARLVFLAFLGLTGSIIYNALYLQDSHSTGLAAASSPPRQVTTTPVSPPPVEVAKLPPVSTDLPPLEVEEGSPQLLLRAVQRELAARGFDVGPADGKPSDKTRAAISAYEKGQGRAVTGVATDELLRHILLGASLESSVATGSVGGANGGSAKADKPKEGSTVKAVQQILADLGYAPGPVDGAPGEATTRAISIFQRDRKIAETGRITPELLRELKRVTGRDLTKTAAKP